MPVSSNIQKFAKFIVQRASKIGDTVQYRSSLLLEKRDLGSSLQKRKKQKGFN